MTSGSASRPRRATAFGIRYLQAVLPTLSVAKREELEDYAFEVSRILMDTRLGPSMRQTMLDSWAGTGVDPADVMRALVAEQDKLHAIAARRGGRKGPVPPWPASRARSSSRP